MVHCNIPGMLDIRAREGSLNVRGLLLLMRNAYGLGSQRDGLPPLRRLAIAHLGLESSFRDLQSDVEATPRIV